MLSVLFVGGTVASWFKSALYSRASGLGWSLCQGHCVAGLNVYFWLWAHLCDQA